MYQLEILLFTLLLTVVLYNGSISGGEDCIIAISGFNYKNEPILLRGSSILAPNDGGNIAIQSGDSIRVACPGNTNAVVVGGTVQTSNVVSAVCQGNSQFKISNHDAFIETITCKEQVQASVIPSTTTCSGKTSENDYQFDIGFKINTEVVSIISGCYSDALKQTVYIKHVIPRGIAYSAVNVPRPNWDDEGKDINNLYTKQREIINELLNLSPTDDKYIKNAPSKYRLSRGHLAAKADFIYGTQQRATFFISNSSPQWLTNNDANFRYLEECIRDLAANTYKDYEIYTGTYGVSELPREGSTNLVQLFLGRGDQVPVPKFFWKVVRDPGSKKATVFVVFNNPYDNKTDEVCQGHDYCNKITYLDKRIVRDDYVTGFTVCCTVEDFRKTVTVLPEFKTTGLLT